MTRGMRGTVLIAGVVLAGAVTIPSAAGAQAKFELIPFVGSYYPLASMCTDCNRANDNSAYIGKQLSTFAVGGGLSYMLSSTVGITATAAWSPSRVEETQDDTTSALRNLGIRYGTSTKGTIFLATVRALFRPARTNVHFIVGGGIVQRGGDFWKYIKDNNGLKATTPMGVLGVGVRASVTPKFQLDINAEGDFYSFDPHFGTAAVTTDGTKLQTDLLLTVGVPITLHK